MKLPKLLFIVLVKGVITLKFNFPSNLPFLFLESIPEFSKSFIDAMTELNCANQTFLFPWNWR